MPEERTDRTQEIARLESEVKNLWASVLNTNQIGVRDHFLDIGGDSLSAMVCISRLRNLYNLEFTVEDFFLDHATIADFSLIIAQSRLRDRLEEPPAVDI